MAGTFTPRFTSEGIWQNPIYYTPNSYPEMPNCTNYAYGRYWEITGQNPTGLQFLGDGGSWYWNVPSTFNKGLTPALGAIVCTGASGWAGHVAVVEQILPNGDIITSNSGYRRPLTSYPPSMSGYFWTEVCYKDAYGANQYLSSWEASRGYGLRGFIYADNYAPSPEGWIVKDSDVPSDRIMNLQEMQNNASIIYNTLREKGWTPESISGLMGNLQYASQINPGYIEEGYGYPVQSSNTFSGSLGLLPWNSKPVHSTLTPNPVMWYSNLDSIDWHDGDRQVELLENAENSNVTKSGLTQAPRWGWEKALSVLSNDTYTAWRTTITVNSDGSCSVNTPADGTRGFRGIDFQPDTTKHLIIRLYYTSNNSSTRMRLYIIGTGKNGTANTITRIRDNIPSGQSVFDINLASYAISGSVNFDYPIGILVTFDTTISDTAVFSEFEYGYYMNITDESYSDYTLDTGEPEDLARLFYYNMIKHNALIDTSVAQIENYARTWYTYFGEISPDTPVKPDDYTRKMPTWMKVKPHRRRLF